MKIWLLTCWFLFTWGVAIFAQNEGLNFYAEGEDYRKKGQFPQALAKYEEALRREPNNYRYLFAKAQTLEKFKNKVDEALAVLNTAVRLRSDYAPIYELMARIYKEKKEDFERAAQLYNIAYKNE
ncbi:MAG: tetratricopeptide repeat protein, partial [Bacteroidota bacterium]